MVGAHNASLTNAGQESKKGNDGATRFWCSFWWCYKPVTNSLSLGKDGGHSTTVLIQLDIIYLKILMM